MADTAGTVEQIALDLARALTGLGNRIAGDRLLDLLAELGTAFPPALLTKPQIVAAQQSIGHTSATVSSAAQSLLGAVGAGEADEIVAKGAALLTACGRTAEAYLELANALQAVGPTLPGITPTQVADLVAGFPRKLLDLALLGLVDPGRRLTRVLALFGLAEVQTVDADPANPSTVDHQRVTLRLDRLPGFLLNPVDQLRQRYGWGEAGFDGELLLKALHALLVSLRLPALYRPAAEGQPAALEAWAFDITLGEGGLELRVVMPVGAMVTRTVTVSPEWEVELDAEGVLPPGAAGRLRPPFELDIPGEETELRGSVELRYTAPNRFLVLGTAGGSRIEVGEVGIRAGLALVYADGSVTGEPTVAGDVRGGKLVIDASNGDGFLTTLLGGGRLETDFEVGFSFSPEDGLNFHGGAGLTIQLPLHVRLGPIDLRAIRIAANPSGSGVPIELSATIGAELGPIRAVVERLGLVAELRFPEGGGNLGPVDLAFAFKPPDGVGLSLDAGIVSGGGYLYADPEHGEYAGALELEFAGVVEVKAIGLITTRMPDGSSGFSLLIVLSAEFGGGGVQLGFGFTLLGVGGILGLNRRMNLDALVEGVVTGSIQSVMFPKDVVANAPRIISDLRKFFPPQDDTFLVGPMAKIGWGTPTLISVSLGVIVEIPPGNIAILGLLECVLPSKDVPLVVLKVSFIGALEVDKSRLWFFARMFDSRILAMTIDGGLGLLVAWGDNPDFVLSIGGFHPAFSPPPLPFPAPPRITVDILNGPGQLIRVSGYLAVTSNTVQFGAEAEMRLGFGDFGIEGHLSFDALFRFSPFSFVIQISAGVSLKAFGVGLFSIDLDFTLEGPAPWRAHGRGSISLLFFEISADFDITWGEERTTTLPPVVVLALLEGEVRKTEGWQTRLPAGGTNPLVTLRQLPPGDDLVLHPLGSLFIHQRAIPLGVRIDRVGGQRPSDGRRFTVEPAQNSGFVRQSVIGDKFAMAQFQDMDDAAKLSRPAYETQDAGLELVAAGGAIASPRVVRRSARYEMSVIDNEAPSVGGAVMRVRTGNGRRRGKLYSPPSAVFGQLLTGNSTARSPLSRQEARQRQPFPVEQTVRVTGDRYVVAYLRNNHQAFPPATAGATTSSFRSAATAADAMADWIRLDPALAGQLHVLPQAEVRGGVLAGSGVWSAAGSPPVAVSGADAVRLGNGQVLVAGGADATGSAVATSALFDPVARTWARQTASLATARQQHTTTKLVDGRVVAAGGLGATGGPVVTALDASDTPLASVEVFDPATGTWTTPQGGLATARSGHSATVVAKRLLVAGGTGARGVALASAELLDPATLTWAAVGPMTDARTGHAAVFLPSTGKVLVVGGAVPTGDGERALASCELYDPDAKTWTPTGSLAVPRKGHRATLLPNGKVLVTGGDAIPAVPYRVESLTSAEVYDPQTGAWTPVADLPGGGRSGHRCVPTSRGAVVIGGVGRPRATAGFREVVAFDPATGSWTGTGALATGRWDFPAVDLADGRVLVVGGRALSGPAAPGPAQLATTAETYLP
ncbi:DUF6603 domain-containing protein [Saccharothrix yanglingensis]|uniref:DUF6603 domain-containing protein n=1 Tax=Saccharothrix yanglingensis TaxID=659496 RepID=A0ABU0X8E0_9PSEU|nr:DUF6603 domain-containing protein [Saccharothrix yanglingensis]MDQ2588400.1 hypothetical protein [Saccharothrix yanglingensis]